MIRQYLIYFLPSNVCLFTVVTQGFEVIYLTLHLIIVLFVYISCAILASVISLRLLASITACQTMSTSSVPMKNASCIGNYFSFCHYTNNIVFVEISVVKRDEFRSCSNIIAKVTLFGYAIYSSADSCC